VPVIYNGLPLTGSCDNGLDPADCCRRVCGQHLAWSFAVGLDEEAIELRITAKARGIRGFREVGFRRSFQLLPEARHAEGTAIVSEGNSDLLVKKTAEVRVAYPAARRKCAERSGPLAFAQQTNGLLHGRVQFDRAFAGRMAVLESPAERKKKVQASVQAIRIGVLITKIRIYAKTSLPIQKAAVERTLHNAIHGIPNGMKIPAAEHRVLNTFGLGPRGIQHGVSRCPADPANEGGLEHRDIVLCCAGAVYELMLLFREEPKLCARREGVSLVSHDVRDAAADDQIELKFDVVMALKPGRIRAGLGEKEKPFVYRADLEVVQHEIKIQEVSSMPQEDNDSFRSVPFRTLR
jgi:hypothetical protein